MAEPVMTTIHGDETAVDILVHSREDGAAVLGWCDALTGRIFACHIPASRRNALADALRVSED